MTIAEARADFSSVIERVLAGEKITVTKGKKRIPLVTVIPFDIEGVGIPKKRPLGLLSHWDIGVADDWKMSTEEFLGIEDSSIPLKQDK